MPAATSPGPVPALTIACRRSVSPVGPFRRTMLTRPGEAKPAPADPSMAKAANHVVSGAVAIPSEPALAVAAAARITLRGCREATANATIAPTQYTIEAPDEIRPAVAAPNDKSACTSGRNSP